MAAQGFTDWLKRENRYWVVAVLYAVGFGST
jgi:hypothetical protein